MFMDPCSKYTINIYYTPWNLSIYVKSITADKITPF